MVRSRGSRQAGFTLIELLVVVVIIGILIAIAVPLYLNYRRGANDKAAQSDLRNAVSVLEVCFAQSGAYPAAITVNTAGGACAGQTVNVTPGSTLAYFPISATDLSGYIVGSSASGGTSGRYYCYNSTKGGSLTTAPAVTAWRTAC